MQQRSFMGIDKVTVRIDMKYINREFKGFYKYEGDEIKGINVINKNRFYYINFHDCLFVNPNIMISEVIIRGLYSLFNAKRPLLKVEPTWNFIANECVLSEFEVFFDSYNYNPFTIYQSPKWRMFENSTIYSGDFEHKYKKDGRLKETQHSLICIYNRGLKIGSPENIVRFEYRLRGKYIKNLKIWELTTDFFTLYTRKLQSMLVKYTGKLIDEKMIQFHYQDLIRTNNLLMPILRETKTFRYMANYEWNAFKCINGGGY